MAGFLKGGKFKPTTSTTANTVESSTETIAPATKPLFGKKKLGGLNKPKIEEPNEIIMEEEPQKVVEESIAEVKTEVAPKPKLGAKKKLGGLKATPAPTPEEKKIIKEVEAEIAAKEDSIAEAEFCGDVDLEKELPEPNEVEIKEEAQPIEEVPKKTKAKRTSRKKATSNASTTVDEEGNVSIKATTISAPIVDESKRISIEEMDAIMKPIVAPTTEAWEQEKNDVLNALEKIKVDQDMSMEQVKFALAELDDIRFEILPKQHDAETMYDGTKQNYETVKAIAIAEGNATNAEGRKALGILACKNYVTPNGEVVDLQQYMLLIEERNKFYQKAIDTINFKKYSLVNYNKALSLETKDL